MTTAPLSHDETRDRLRLARTDHVGPITFRQLIARYGDAASALEALPELSRRGGRRAALRPFPRDAAEAEIDALDAFGARLIALGDADYPPLLAASDSAPPTLAMLGRSELLHRPAVAIVGARNASGNGRGLATELARDLGAAGLAVVSGLARGIDAAAHVGALDSGTIAVVAGGLDVIYPPEHQELHERIARDGVVVSEMPPGTQPTARHFPRRNRIIAGLALGVLVVEAARRSGSLITARLALEQGREVFAVPGSPRDPRANGTNDLIRQGTVLTQSAQDVLEVVAPMTQRPRPPAPLADAEAAYAEADDDALDVARAAVAEALSPAPTPVDDVVRATGLAAATVLSVLLELELAGRLERQPGNRIAAL